ncbi:Soluble lytic murein transglycosylase [uncultured bacterium]|nr:Soluble lytic murein transglycosylase [uncultured bacterium]
MFHGKLNKMNLKKVLAVFCLALVIEAGVMPSFASRFVALLPQADRDASMLDYVRSVLKENRTGLGSIEELKLAETILVESVTNKLDPLFVLALMKTESTFYNWSRSFNGALGLMQILPSTGQELAGELNLKWDGEGTLLDPYANVKMGVRYFSKLQDRYKDTETSLTAYNVGPGRVDSAEEELPQGFARKVLSNYRYFKERADFY